MSDGNEDELRTNRFTLSLFSLVAAKRLEAKPLWEEVDSRSLPNKGPKYGIVVPP